MEEMWHGTYAGYCKHACRCADCTEAMRVYKRKWSATEKAKQSAKNKRTDPERVPQIHGTRASYINYGCRCDECLNANRDYHAARNYGMEPGRYLQMYQDQGGVCAICGSSPGFRGLAVDHCHETGAIRGLLCVNCNTGLGSFKDSIDNLESAISYLNTIQ